VPVNRNILKLEYITLRVQKSAYLYRPLFWFIYIWVKISQLANCMSQRLKRHQLIIFQDNFKLKLAFCLANTVFEKYITCFYPACEYQIKNLPN
jgi:hypothetical protein